MLSLPHPFTYSLPFRLEIPCSPSVDHPTSPVFHALRTGVLAYLRRSLRIRSNFAQMTSSPFVVDRVVVGYGETDNSTRRLDERKLYGATGLNGGHESFWPLSESTFRVSLWTLSALCRVDVSNFKPGDKEAMQKHLLHGLVKWLRNNKGVPVVIGGVGARGHISNARRFQVRTFGPNLVVDNNGSCVPASLSTGVAALYQNEEGLKVRDYSVRYPKSFTTLKQIFEDVGKLRIPLVVR